MTAAYILSYVDRQVLSIMVEPIRHDLGISDTQIGLLQGIAFSIFYVIAGVPLAKLIDSGNRRNIAAISVTFWSIMTAACGFARSFSGLLLARVGVSIGEAGLPPAALSMMSDMFPRERLARATSFFMIGPYVGGGLALLLGGILLQHFSGIGQIELPAFGEIRPWQATLIAVALPGFVIALLLRATVKEPMRSQADDAAPSLGVTGEYFWTHRSRWLPHFIAVSLVAMIAFAHMAWIPSLLVRQHAVTAAWVGAVYGPLYLAAGIAGALLGGSVSSRARAEPARAVSRGLVIATACLILPSIAAPLLPDPRFVLVLLAPSIVCYSMIIGLAPVPIQMLVPNRMRARFTALLALASSLIGVGAGPTIVGVLADYVFHDSSYGALAISLATVAAIAAPLATWLFLSAAKGEQILSSAEPSPATAK
jgi:MFS family permease